MKEQYKELKEDVLDEPLTAGCFRKTWKKRQKCWWEGKIFKFIFCDT